MNGPLVSMVGDLVGTKYVEGGLDPVGDGGLDCFGLTRLVLGRLGVEIPDSPEGTLAAPPAGARDLGPREACVAGDVIVMQGEGDADAHLGIALDAFYMIHATRAAGVAIDSIDRWDAAGKVTGRVRIPLGEGVSP